jgi:hypothetical protein
MHVSVAPVQVFIGTLSSSAFHYESGRGLNIGV